MDRKSYKDYLKEFEGIILELLEKERLDKSVASLYEKEKLSDYIYKRTRKLKAEEIKPGERIHPNYQVRIYVTPKRFDQTFLLEEDWAENPDSTSLIRSLKLFGRKIWKWDNSVIIDGLLNEVKAEFSKGEIEERFNEANNWLKSNEHEPNILLINQRDLINLRMRARAQIPDNLGIQPALIETGIALIYEKDKIILERTPVKIKFDNIDDPKNLIVSEERILYSNEDKVVAKIILNENSE